jgi:hypothetical protein
MLSSDEFGRKFIMLTRDEPIASTLRMVAGMNKGKMAQKRYAELYKNCNDIELLRNVTAIAVDSTCQKLLDLLGSGQITHTPIEGSRDLVKEMTRDGGWMDRFSIFGNVKSK